MRRTRKLFYGIGLLFAVLLIGAVGSTAQISLGEFDRALDALTMTAHDRILAAIEGGLSQPGFPADTLLTLIQRLASIPGGDAEKETILLMFARAMEGGLLIDGLLPKGFELASALEEGLPIEGVVLEALKGIAQGSPISMIAGGITQRLKLLRGVRDLLFAREIFRAVPGSPQSSPTALPASRFDQLVVQIADAVSDYLEGGGSPFEGGALYTLVADRLRRLPEAIVSQEDVDLVLDRIGPPDLTQVALAALT
ncbi:MAG: hypothetical protein WBC63_00235 [Candidatus Bipolaricaulia bacterium]